MRLFSLIFSIALTASSVVAKETVVLPEEMAAQDSWVRRNVGPDAKDQSGARERPPISPVSLRDEGKPSATLSAARRELLVEKRYLNLPVKNGAPTRRLSVAVDGKRVREFDIELADAAPDWWAFMDLAAFQGKKATLEVNKLPADSGGLKSIEQGDTMKGAENLYREKLRPQFHFTTRRGWNNDPNGLVFYKGEYHLFYQHNPYGWNWGNMHWGQAVSPDLVHWTELPVALYPDQHGPMFSGSAVVDWNNTAGFQTGAEKVLVCIFAAAGHPFSQGLAFSNDRGRTWTKYKSNPVVPQIEGDNRDPKVFWYAPERKWIMALFLDKNNYALLSSTELKNWKRMSSVSVPGTSECPEFFEIAVDGNRRNTRWIFYGGNGGYLIGTFDGTTFQPQSGPHALNAGNCFYASQTFNDIPAGDGRRILMPWGTMAMPEMPFNQMIGLPVELTLRTTEEGLRLFANPVKELESLRTGACSLKARSLQANGNNPLAGVKGELLDIVAELTPGNAAEVGFVLRGIPVIYETKDQQLVCCGKSAALKMVEGKIRLRLLVDRASIDLFGNDGRLYMPMGVVIPSDNTSLDLYAKGGSAEINALEVYPLQSAWNGISRTFSTRFEGSEGPLSEAGAWTNNGVDWTQIRKKDGLAYGTQSGTNTGLYKFNDSYAHLSGFAPDQEAWGEARIARPNASCNQELEILLRFTSSPHCTTGYECFARCLTSASSYVQIVRWDGPLGKFTYLADKRGTNYGLNDGDILKASVIGNVITVSINGVEKARARDDTFRTGNPGIGEFLAGQTGQGPGSNSDFGFASFTARGLDARTSRQSIASP